MEVLICERALFMSELSILASRLLPDAMMKLCNPGRLALCNPKMTLCNPKEHLPVEAGADHLETL